VVEDRFSRGFVSGIIAGVPTLIFNNVAYYLNLSTLRWLDFGGILILGKKPGNLLETLFSAVGVYFFVGVLGIIFCFLTPRISSKNYLLKTWVYGTSLWFIFYAMLHLFQVPQLIHIPLKTALLDSIGASIWGLSLGLILRWFDNRVKV